MNHIKVEKNCMGRAAHPGTAEKPHEHTDRQYQLCSSPHGTESSLSHVLKVTSDVCQPHRRQLQQQLRYSKELHEPPLTLPLFIALIAAFNLIPWLFFFTWCILGMCVPNFSHCWSLLLLTLADLTFCLDLRPVLLLQVFPTVSELWVAPITAMGLVLLKCLKAVLFSSELAHPSSSAPDLSSVQEQLSLGCYLPPSQQVFQMCMNSNP